MFIDTYIHSSIHAGRGDFINDIELAQAAVYSSGDDTSSSSSSSNFNCNDNGYGDDNGDDDDGDDNDDDAEVVKPV